MAHDSKGRRNSSGFYCDTLQLSWHDSATWSSPTLTHVSEDGSGCHQLLSFVLAMGPSRDSLRLQELGASDAASHGHKDTGVTHILLNREHHRKWLLGTVSSHRGTPHRNQRILSLRGLSPAVKDKVSNH